MIHPNMATTLGFVMTDAAISPIHLRQMLVNTVERTFNRLSVDGDMSTNDIVVLLANGASGIRPSERERRSMEESLCLVMEDLAEQIARDGEGATKLITIRVVGAAGRGIGRKDRAQHRELSAGEDGDRRFGPELGTCFFRGRNCGRRVRSEQGRHLHAGRAGVRQRCCGPTSRRRT